MFGSASRKRQKFAGGAPEGIQAEPSIKLLCEKRSPSSSTHLLLRLGVLCDPVAKFFFLRLRQPGRKSPAHSATLNRDCDLKMFRAPLLPSGDPKRFLYCKKSFGGGSSIAAGRYRSFPRRRCTAQSKMPTASLGSTPWPHGHSQNGSRASGTQIASTRFEAVKYHCAVFAAGARDFDGGGPRTKQAFRPLTQI